MRDEGFPRQRSGTRSATNFVFSASGRLVSTRIVTTPSEAERVRPSTSTSLYGHGCPTTGAAVVAQALTKQLNNASRTRFLTIAVAETLPKVWSVASWGV